MIFSITSAVSTFILFTISSLGYWGVFMLMTFESVDIPFPSEIVMPFAGFLAYIGRFDIILVILVAALGNVFGSLINYWIAYRYQEQAATFLERVHLMSAEERASAYDWFKTRGLAAVFLGRLLPIVRTFISFPAGMFKVNLKHFIILTFIGSFVWSAMLAYIGYFAGYNWAVLEPYFRQFDYLVLAILVIGIIWELNKRFKRRKAKLNK